LTRERFEEEQKLDAQSSSIHSKPQQIVKKGDEVRNQARHEQTDQEYLSSKKNGRGWIDDNCRSVNRNIEKGNGNPLAEGSNDEREQKEIDHGQKDATNEKIRYLERSFDRASKSEGTR
jgi:hypothetical protein